jgi:diadenosine tetraphosphatase ApaH/serine/threonine PP2A family protein phosphatase
MLEFGERCPEALQHFGTGWRDSIDPRVSGPFRLGRAEPAASCHPREQRVQCARAQSIAVTMQLLQHPMPIHTLLFRVMKDVNLPEREQEFPHHGIIHGNYSNTDMSGCGLVFPRPDLDARTQFVGTAPRNFIAGFQVTEYLDKRS